MLHHSDVSDGEPNLPPDSNPGYDFMFTVLPDSLIPRSWVLLDSQSTCNVFNNRHLLQNIRTAPEPLTAYTNGGCQVSTLIGDIPNFGPVYYNPESLANILSLSSVTTVCRVTMDTDLENCMIVHRRDGSHMKFVQWTRGL